MLITTKDNIKKLLGITNDTDNDLLLVSIALAVSAHIEKYLRRQIESKERTRFFDVESRQSVFSLDAYPVSACAVYNDYDRLFSSNTVVPSSDYSVAAETGLLVVDKFTLTAGPQMLKVVYTGGLAASQQTLESSYPDIEQAARIQGAYWFQNRNKLGIVGEGMAGASITHYQKFELLPTVKEILQPHRRATYAI